jgi:hypothetical protein
MGFDVMSGYKKIFPW